jgi:hypothetical protein
LIEPQGNRVQITLRGAREVGSSREVLTQQAIGVLAKTSNKLADYHKPRRRDFASLTPSSSIKTPLASSGGTGTGNSFGPWIS